MVRAICRSRNLLQLTKTLRHQINIYEFLSRSIELLENHFDKGQGVLNAVQARLSRRQLPRVTPEGLVEYSLQIPTSAIRACANGGSNSFSSSGHLQDSFNASTRTMTPQPLSNGANNNNHNHNHQSYGADIDWILAGKSKHSFFRSIFGSSLNILSLTYACKYKKLLFVFD